MLLFLQHMHQYLELTVAKAADDVQSGRILFDECHARLLVPYTSLDRVGNISIKSARMYQAKNPSNTSREEFRLANSP